MTYLANAQAQMYMKYGALLLMILMVATSCVGDYIEG